MENKSKSVGIIGGGLSGIFAAIECQKLNWSATIFDLNESFGGIWRKTTNNSSANIFQSAKAHENTTFNTSSYTSSLLLEPSLYEFVENNSRKGENPFPTAEEFKKYIALLVDKYDLSDKMYFRHRVTMIQYDQIKNQVKFEADVLSLTSDEIIHKYENWFDFVVVATGANGIPFYPSILGLPDFHPQIYHSNNFNPRLKSDDYERVLIVGGSISASEIVDELLVNCEHSPITAGLFPRGCAIGDFRKERKLKQIYWTLSSRKENNNIWIMPRNLPNGRPFDEGLNRFTIFGIPTQLKNFLFSRAIKRLTVSEKHSYLDFDRDYFIFSNPTLFQTAKQNQMLQLTKPLKAMKIHQLDDQKTIIQCEFIDNSIVEVDAVVFATGYKRDFSFIPLPLRQELSELFNSKVKTQPEICRDIENLHNLQNSPLKWEQPMIYRNTLPLNENLLNIGFIGKTRYSGSLPCLQMEARWLIHQWKTEKWTKDQQKAVREQIINSKTDWRDLFISKTLSHVEAIESLAVDLQIQPSGLACLIRPSRQQHQLGLAILFGPFTLYHYELADVKNLTQQRKQFLINTIIQRSQLTMGKSKFNRISACYSLIYFNMIFLLFPLLITWKFNWIKF